MAGERHELGHRGAGDGSVREPGVAEVVEVSGRGARPARRASNQPCPVRESLPLSGALALTADTRP